MSDARYEQLAPFLDDFERVGREGPADTEYDRTLCKLACMVVGIDLRCVELLERMKNANKGMNQ